jgi:hypothetical protein
MRWLLALAMLPWFCAPAHAASTVDPAVPSFQGALTSGPLRTNFSRTFNDINGIESCFVGIVSPSGPLVGQCWQDTSASATVPTFRVYDGASWVAQFSLDTVGHKAGWLGGVAGLSGLGIRDTSAAFDLTLGATSSVALTAGRTLTFDVVDGNRTIKLQSNLTIITDPGGVTGALKSNGAGLFAQAGCADLAGVAASCSTDTTNASNISIGTLPQGRLPSVVEQHVATNAALTASSTVTYPNGVWRDDYATGNGAPPLFYRASGSVCSLNAGAGDNGSQVLSSDGKCWLASFPADPYDIRQFGGIGDGSTNNATAFNNALAAQSASGQIGLYFPKGTFNFSASVSYTLPSATAAITLAGDSQQSSILRWPSAGGGMTINYPGQNNQATIHHLSFVTSQVGGGNALSLIQTLGTIGNPANTPLTLLDNLNFHGNDGYAVAQYWTIALNITGVSNVNLTNSNIVGIGSAAGTGIVYLGTATAQAVVFNMIGVTLNYLNIGLNFGPYAQGITMSGGSNCVGSNYCFWATNGNGLDQLTVVGNQFNANIEAMHLAGAPVDLIVADNLFLLSPANAYGINVTTGATRTLIHHNHFHGFSTGQTGINIAGIVVPWTIDHNTFTNLNIGIWMVTTTYNYDIKFDGNNFVTVTNNYGLGASSKGILEVSLAFASVLACDAAHLGRQQIISDSNTAVFLATIAGGGANIVNGICNGTNWTVH